MILVCSDVVALDRFIHDSSLFRFLVCSSLALDRFTHDSSLFVQVCL